MGAFHGGSDGAARLDVSSPEEAVEWAKRAPMEDDDITKVRRVQEMSDFPEDVREAAAGFE